MAEGIVQQPRLAALARPAGWLQPMVGKDVDQVAPLAPRIAHHEVAEEPRLQGVAALAPQPFKGLDALRFLPFAGLERLAQGSLPQLPAMQLGVLKLPAADVGLVGFVLSPRLVGRRTRRAGRPFPWPRAGQLRQLLAEVYDCGLLALEIAVGLQIIEHGRHEVRPVAAPAYLPAVAGEKLITGRRRAVGR